VRVDSISTTNFRNVITAEISFSPGVNLLIGENGQGKTNLLEAISFFKLGRSFRATRDPELIRFGETYCRVVAACQFETNEQEIFSVAISDSGEKKLKINEDKISKLSDLIGRYPAVMFGPHDLNLVTGPPGGRRRFLDMVGSMVNRPYVETLKNYRRILNQRNAALKARADKKERTAWNERLVEKGCELVIFRTETTNKIAQHLCSHADILESPFSFSLEYSSTLLRGDDGSTAVGLAESFMNELEAAENEELRRGMTLVGPHRDDVDVELDGQELKKYGSQGQKRLFAILAKLAELSFLEAELGERCVLLLDDVFSEFDHEITSKLQHVLEEGRQVFVTSPVSLNWERSHKARVFRIQAGRATT
jgi:DNA replication and repair protein RecF